MLKYFICFSLIFIVSDAVFDSGEFDLKITQYKQCNGPKRRDCIEVQATVIDYVNLKYNFFVKEDMTGVKGKIIGSLNNKELLRIQIKNICEHTFIKPVIESLFNVRQCGVHKGHYSIQVNIQTLSRRFYGSRFMYGDWTFKILFHNDHCNMYCAYLNMTLTPTNVEKQ